jgi:hypothetical protein
MGQSETSEEGYIKGRGIQCRNKELLEAITITINRTKELWE